MLETYKILHNIYDKSVTPILILNKFISTRGNNLKLEIQGSKHDFRKNSFCVRIPHIGNNLPNYVVIIGTLYVLANCIKSIANG